MRKSILFFFIFIIYACPPCDREIIENGPLPQSALDCVPYQDGEIYKLKYSEDLIISFTAERRTEENRQESRGQWCGPETHYEENRIVLEADYPSVNWPFESRGYPISYVPADANLEDHIWKMLASESVSVFAFSLVQYVDGFRMDLDFLKELKLKYPELILIADGTQFCGAFDFDFAESGIDVLGASGYKWLLAGYGNGFYLFNPELKNRMSLPSIGFNATGGRPDKKAQIPFSRRLEPGHLDSFNFGSLKFSLEWLSKVGMKNITTHNEQLINKAWTTLTDLGVLQPRLKARKEHGPIFSIDPKRGLADSLREAGVIFSERGGRIRLSFHFYNTEKEVEQVMELIKRQL